MSRLPPVDDVSAAHSERVRAHLLSIIGAGSISFAEFMHHALYAPGLGYYVAGARKFGAAGDFVTAPEISPLFGYVLARQVAPVIQAIPNAGVLEPGAGSGALAVSVLARLADLDALPDRYLILEVSPELRERQHTRIAAELPGLLDRVRWLDDLPERFEGVVIANEFADALPVERFAIAHGEVMQARVTATDGDFAWQYRPAPAPLASAVRDVEKSIDRRLEDGYLSELSLAIPQWLSALGACLVRGVAVVVDYGLAAQQYYAPDRSDGWLRCHFRHRAHDDPLRLPGIQDLTAWVDFSAMASAGVDAGFEVAGYMTQADLLLGGGLETELAGFDQLPETERVQLSGQVKLLTLPGEMGENFKCLGLSRGDVPIPAVFRRFGLSRGL